MRSLILATIGLLQAAAPQVTHAPDIAVVLAVSRSAVAGRVDAIRASADPPTIAAAFDEAFVDAAMARLNDQPAAYRESGRVVAALAEASGEPRAVALVAKLADVGGGANPFDPAAPGIEGALSAYLAISSGANDDPAASIAERGRAEAALVAARASGSSVLTCACLAWLGTYAFQGGDMPVARRFLTEAVTLADAAELDRARVALRRTVAATRVLEGDEHAALEELEASLSILESSPQSDEAARSLIVDVATDAIGAAEKIGDRARAVRAAERSTALLESSGAPVSVLAAATERLAQLLAQGASGSPAEARRAAAAFGRVAAIRIEAGEKDHAAITLTAAGVLLLENASPAESREFFERALRLATEARNESLRAGVEYWIGRSHLAEGGARSTERAASLFTTALGRLDSLDEKGGAAPELRVRILIWLGRARSSGPAGPERNLGTAHQAFSRAFDTALDGGMDVNDAVESAEQALRCRAGLGDLKLAGTEAVRFYDRLAGSKRMDPLNAAAALANELQRSATDLGHAGVFPSVVALWDHVAASLGSDPSADRARMALVILAAARRDRELLASRAEPVFASLTASKNASDAETLAEAVWRAWEGLDDATTASIWRDRYATLALASFESAVAAKRPDTASRAAEGLAAVAVSRGNAADEAKWNGERSRLRLQVAERYEADGKLGLAGEAFRLLAAEALAQGDSTRSLAWYGRAVGLAIRANDAEAQALALCGRAAAELASGDAGTALATTTAALRLASSSKMPSDDSLPAVAEVTMRRPAASALSVRADALAKLGRPEHAAAARTLAASLLSP
ncbi:MAG: hypothetical protein IT175_05625 [Acidobacteria bacterium]|nr:hypothetical protein [Acidobacteriota bacterium]